MTNEALPCRWSSPVWLWHIRGSKAGQPQRATLGGWLTCSGRESGEALDAVWGIWWGSLWIHSKEIWGTLEQLHLSLNLWLVFGFGGKRFNTPNGFLWLVQRYPWLHWSRFLWPFWLLMWIVRWQTGRSKWDQGLFAWLWNIGSCLAAYYLHRQHDIF